MSFVFVTLGLAVIAGIGMWADQVSGAHPEWVTLTMIVVSVAAMLTAAALFIVNKVEKIISIARIEG